MPTGNRGLKFKYSSGIAPLVTAKEYSELIDNYKKTGAFPHILSLGGMAIDTSQNRNKWRVPIEDLDDIAAQLVGTPIMKDHDIDHVDSTIGKVEEAWVERDKIDPTVGKVVWKGEIADESLIQKILLGFVKHDSIQVMVPAAYCDNCIKALGRREEEAGIDNLDIPCPRCGSLDMLIRHPGVLEQSIVAIPAYEKAEIMPYGFKASVDQALQRRFEAHQGVKLVKPYVPDATPLLVQATIAVANLMASVVEIQAKVAKLEAEEEIGRTGRMPKGIQHALERLGGEETVLGPESEIMERSEEAFPEIQSLDYFGDESPKCPVHGIPINMHDERQKAQDAELLREGKGEETKQGETDIPIVCPMGDCETQDIDEMLEHLKKHEGTDIDETASDFPKCSDCAHTMDVCYENNFECCSQAASGFRKGGDYGEEAPKGGSLEDFPLVEKGKKEAKPSIDEIAAFTCPICGMYDESMFHECPEPSKRSI